MAIAVFLLLSVLRRCWVPRSWDNVSQRLPHGSPEVQVECPGRRVMRLRMAMSKTSLRNPNLEIDPSDENKRRATKSGVMTTQGSDNNHPWGTIVKPDFPLGYQKLSQGEVNEVVDRLNKIPEQKEPEFKRPNKDMTQEEINEMLERLTKAAKEIPDSDRRVTRSIYKNMGVVSSYAWQGY